MLFRDHTLSDLVGFVYSGMPAAEAAAHFVNSIRDAAAPVLHQGKDVVIPIILDGENAWEYYPFNGYYFLRALYALLAAHPLLELTTLSDCVARALEPLPLQSVVAGSWVHGTLATWMGDPAKNRAWDLLCAAKRSFDAVIAGGGLNAAEQEAATRQLADCEASDWCWWFGDYNPAQSVIAFDRLYRSKLAHLYALLKLPAPRELDTPISAGKGDSQAPNAMRRAS